MITVLIADGQQLVGAALSALIRREPDLRNLGDFSSGPAALRALDTAPADVVVADAALAGIDGIAMAARLRVSSPATRVLILTSGGNPAELKRVLAAGAHGYLRKDASRQVFLGAVRQLAAGYQVFDPTVIIDVVTDFVRAQTPSARELSALRLVASGMSNNEVARSLALSPGTVRNYISSIIAKANARNRIDAVRIAREYAWI